MDVVDCHVVFTWLDCQVRTQDNVSTHDDFSTHDDLSTHDNHHDHYDDHQLLSIINYYYYHHHDDHQLFNILVSHMMIINYNWQLFLQSKYLPKYDDHIAIYSLSVFP